MLFSPLWMRLTNDLCCLDFVYAFFILPTRATCPPILPSFIWSPKYLAKSWRRIYYYYHYYYYIVSVNVVTCLDLTAFSATTLHAVIALFMCLLFVCCVMSCAHNMQATLGCNMYVCHCFASLFSLDNDHWLPCNKYLVEWRGRNVKRTFLLQKETSF